MSYPRLNLDYGKASKSGLKVALHVAPMALRIVKTLLRMHSLRIFDYVYDLSLMVDDLMM